MLELNFMVIRKSSFFRALCLLAVAAIGTLIAVHNESSTAAKLIAYTTGLKRHPRVYMTLIPSEDYDAVAQILVCRLRQFSPSIPIYVLVDRHVDLKGSVDYYRDHMNVRLIRVYNPTQNSAKESHSKFQAWNFDTIETAVYIDPHVVPIQSPESLFELLAPNEQLAISIDDYDPSVFVFRPSTTTFQALVKLLANPMSQASHVLKTYFTEMYPSENGNGADVVYPLPSRFNVRPQQPQSQTQTKQSQTQTQKLEYNTVLVNFNLNDEPWTETLKYRHDHDDFPEFLNELYSCETENRFQYCQNDRTAIQSTHKCYEDTDTDNNNNDNNNNK